MNAVLQGAETGRSVVTGAGACMLKIDEPLRDVNLVVRLNNDVLIRASVFDDAFQIHDDGFATFARQFDLLFIGEISETAGTNDRLADGVGFISRNFLGPLPLDVAVNVNFAA